jgi:hypothetical protein
MTHPAVERIVKKWGCADLTKESFKGKGNVGIAFATKKGLEGQIQSLREDKKLAGQLFYYDPDDSSVKMITVEVD